jgi:hypothetical protein
MFPREFVEYIYYAPIYIIAIFAILITFLHKKENKKK